MTGFAVINGTGNALANVINGSTNTTANVLTGGLGDDTYIVAAGDTVVENQNAGIDLVLSTVSFTLGSNVENLTLSGSSNVNATGNSLSNTLIGNAGANILDGQAGADNMTGGTGNDTYVVDTLSDIVTELAGQGIDTIRSAITYSLVDTDGTGLNGSNIENLTLTGTAVINATGNTLANTIDGITNTAANVLAGGAGNDTYIVGAGDTIVENFNEGTDTVSSSVTFTLGNNNVENLSLTGSSTINGTGNVLANIINGSTNTAANVLTGGAGNDTYVVGVGDTVIENFNEGTDGVQSPFDYVLGANLENLILTSTAVLGTGNDLANGLTGNASSNLLTGGIGNDTLNGSAGVDIMQSGADIDVLTDTSGVGLFDGGAGADTLTGGVSNELFVGGIGNDTINTSIGFDVIAFNYGDGQDTLNASTGQDNTVSLGGTGINYANLQLRRATNDLILDVGGSNQLTFKNWYVGITNKSVAKLQVIAEAMSGYNASSIDPLLNKKVQAFDFTKLVTDFDAATGGASNVNWALTNKLLDEHLAASSGDTAALGGELSYYYGKNNTSASVGLTAAQSILSTAGFGQNTQAFLPAGQITTGVVKLS